VWPPGSDGEVVFGGSDGKVSYIHDLNGAECAPPHFHATLRCSGSAACPPVRSDVPTQVRVGLLKNNKPATLYHHPSKSAVVSMAASPDGTALISAHSDAQLLLFRLHGAAPGAAAVGFTRHSCPPHALAWGAAVVAVGQDTKVRALGG
jgi:hypothetical protein